MDGNKCWWTCREVELSYTVSGQVNGVATSENSLAAPQRVKHRVTTWPNNFTPKHIPKGIETYVYIKSGTKMFILALLILVKSKNNTNVHQLVSG